MNLATCNTQIQSFLTYYFLCFDSCRGLAPPSVYLLIIQTSLSLGWCIVENKPAALLPAYNILNKSLSVCGPHLSSQKVSHSLCPENKSFSTKLRDSMNQLVLRHFCHSLSFLACHIYLEGTAEAPIVGKCWRGDCVRPTKWQLQLTATDGTPRLQSDTPPPPCCCHAPCHYCGQRNNMTLSREGLYGGPKKCGQTLPTTTTALYTDEWVSVALFGVEACL